MMTRCLALGVLLLASAGPFVVSQSRSSRDALAALGGLVGTWNGTGIPTGSREEQRTGFWTETLTCEWQFKGGDAWLKLAFAKGKHFTSGEIRHVAGASPFRVTLKTTDKKDLTFDGTIKEKVLTVLRHDKDAKEEQRLVVTLLHDNRILYRYDVKPDGRGLFYKRYQVGANKEGVAFATGDGKPECIVSGGLGTMPVSYMGKTYYVCCGGCRDEFRDNAKKYVDEYEQKLKAKRK